MKKADINFLKEIKERISNNEIEYALQMLSDWINEIRDEDEPKNKILYECAFFLCHEWEGTLHAMADGEAEKFLENDMAIRAMSAASRIAEHEIYNYTLKHRKVL